MVIASGVCDKCNGRRHVRDTKTQAWRRCDCMMGAVMDRLMVQANIPPIIKSLSWEDMKGVWPSQAHKRWAKLADRWLRGKEPASVEWLRSDDAETVLQTVWLILTDAIQARTEEGVAYFMELDRYIEWQFTDQRLEVSQRCEAAAIVGIYAHNPKGHSYGGPLLHDLCQRRKMRGLPTLVASRDYIDNQHARYGRDCAGYFASHAVTRTEAAKDGR